MNPILSNHKIDLLDSYDQYKLDHQDENDDADEGKEELGLLLDVLIFFSFLGFEAFWLNLIKLT